MHKLSALLLSGVFLLCASSPALADAYITNQDSVTRTIFVKCEGDKGTKHTITSGNGVHVAANLLNAGEGGCGVGMGSEGINLYDGEEYYIENGVFTRQR